MTEDNLHAVTAPSQVMTAPRRQLFTIGLPAVDNSTERRFPLTPEGAGLLTEAGFRVKLQQGASSSIHYTDNRYMKAGAEIVSRPTALACDIVIHLAPPAPADIRQMKRGAMLLGLFNPAGITADAVKELLRRHVTTIALHRITDRDSHTPFADILAEIDGRAAMALCSSLLARPDHGKGILLGGVAGIIPCEVTMIGSGIAARAAAASAIGLGATVRMLDNDVYRLREATVTAGPGIITSSIHPHVLENALRSADVVIATEVSPRYTVDSSMVDVMKKGVIVMDLNPDESQAFPSLPKIDIIRAAGASFTERVCYTGIGNAVPRTAAMALSNTLLPMMNRIARCESITDAARLLPDLHKAVYTFMGKAVDPAVAKIAGTRPMDINLLLNCS